MDDEGVNGGGRIEVRVVPGARTSALERMDDGVWKVRLRARPVEGQANAALIEQLAEWLGIRKSALRIVRGATSRLKSVEFEGIDSDEAERRLRAIAQAAV